MRKKQNILSVSLAFVLACMVFIPSGCKNGWPLWLYFVAIVLFCGGIGYCCWNNPFITGPMPIDDMSGRDKVLYFSTFFILIFAFDMIFGMFGYAWWLVILGCLLSILSALALRYLTKTYCKKSLDK